MKTTIKIFLSFILVFGLFLSGIGYSYRINEKTLSVFNTNKTEKELYNTIIIDPGHGGEDGGTVGVEGIVEKNINLGISLKLKDILEKQKYNVIMTRETDISIYDEGLKSLRQKKVSDIHNRMKIIEETENCIFISIHQNHYGVSKYNGAQVFYSKNNEKSAILAQEIQKSIVESLQPDNLRQTKQAGTSIYLLYHSDVPSVMVECGFLSNSVEAKKLIDEEYQMQISKAISEGIIKFLKAENNYG